MNNMLWYIPNHEIITESKICFLDGQNGKRLVVNSNEGDNIPHFHIMGPDFNTRIAFLENSYVKHKDPVQPLNPRELKKLVNLLPTIIKMGKFKGFTVWEALIVEWNKAHPNHTLDKNLPIPDYKNIIIPK